MQIFHFVTVKILLQEKSKLIGQQSGAQSFTFRCFSTIHERTC